MYSNVLMYNITLMNGTDNLFEASTDRRQYELYALNLSTRFNYQFNVISYDAEGRANKSSNSQLFSIS